MDETIAGIPNEFLIGLTDQAQLDFAGKLEQQKGFVLGGAFAYGWCKKEIDALKAKIVALEALNRVGK